MKKIIIIAIAMTMMFWSGYKVKADTITSWTTQQARVQTTHDGTDSWTNWTNISGDNAVIFNSLTNPVKAIAWRVKTNNGMSNLNVYSFKFSYKPTPDAIHPSSYYMQNDTTGEQEEITCTITRNESSGYYWYDCSFQPQTSYTSSDYLYIKINFTLSYLTEMRMSIRGYDERKGTNAVITEQTNNIITNNEQNTQEIIDSLTQANENLLNGLSEQNQVCKLYDKTIIEKDNYYISNNQGAETQNNAYGITKYLDINNNSKIYSISTIAAGGIFACFYDNYKTRISCINITDNREITIPNNARYIRWSINKYHNVPQLKICNSGNQAINDTLNQDHTYTNQADISTEVEQEQQLEQNINNNLDTQFLDNMNITLGTEPSNYVWNKMTMIYNLNNKWQIFIYTVLGLGIIKLILGR